MIFCDANMKKNPGLAKMFIMSQLKPRLDYQCKALQDAFAAFTKDEAKIASSSKNAFALMDKNGDGTLEVNEVAAVLERDMGYSCQTVGHTATQSETDRKFFEALGLDTEGILQKAGDEWDKEEEAKKKAKKAEEEEKA